MRFRQFYILIFCLFIKTELFSEQIIFKCNVDTLRENLVIPCYDMKVKPGREILIFKYSGNIDSLVKYISLAHKSSIPLIDEKTNSYTWKPLQEPFWFYADYAVKLKLEKLNNFSIIEISFYYAEKFHGKKNDGQIFPFEAQIFYQNVVNKLKI